MTILIVIFTFLMVTCFYIREIFYVVFLIPAVGCPKSVEILKKCEGLGNNLQIWGNSFFLWRMQQFNKKWVFPLSS